MKLIDMTGKAFGRLTVISRAEDRVTPSGRKITRWLCSCACGEQSVVYSGSLSRGLTKSCGCYSREKLVEHGKKVNLKHGQNHKGKPTPEYQAWQSMISRCERLTARGYENYGGRGISVCRQWRESFEQFFADMGCRPSDTHSMDRIDVNGNYEPDNCRWATKAMQSRNVRKSIRNSTGVKGVQKRGKSGYTATIRANGKSIWLGAFKTVEEAARVRLEAEKEYWGEQ